MPVGAYRYEAVLACWRRKSGAEVIVYSDQASQNASYERQDFLKTNKPKVGMSRRGNCHDNTAAENFFLLLKRERIKTGKYSAGDWAKQLIFDYFGMLYNPARKHGGNDMLSPVEKIY